MTGNMHDNPAALLKRPELLRGASGEHGHGQIPVFNPATGAPFCRVALVGREEAAAMVEYAHHAWREWKRRSAAERAVLLHRYADLILANLDDLAVIMTCEQGKPLAEARGEVEHGARYVRWYAEEARRVYGEVLPLEQAGRRFMTLKEQWGCAQPSLHGIFPVPPCCARWPQRWRLVVRCWSSLPAIPRFPPWPLDFLPKRLAFPMGCCRCCADSPQKSARC